MPYAVMRPVFDTVHHTIQLLNFLIRASKRGLPLEDIGIMTFEEPSVSFSVKDGPVKLGFRLSRRPTNSVEVLPEHLVLEEYCFGYLGSASRSVVYLDILKRS